MSSGLLTVVRVTRRGARWRGRAAGESDADAADADAAASLHSA